LISIVIFTVDGLKVNLTYALICVISSDALDACRFRSVAKAVPSAYNPLLNENTLLSVTAVRISLEIIPSMRINEFRQSNFVFAIELYAFR